MAGTVNRSPAWETQAGFAIFRRCFQRFGALVVFETRFSVFHSGPGVPIATPGVGDRGPSNHSLENGEWAERPESG
jgi:hypothetical protein